MAVKIPYMVNESVGGGSLSQMNLVAPDFRGIAKAIGASGDMATEYFIRKQMERNDTVARKVQTDFTNQALQLESELAQFKGQQALGKTEEYKKKWDDFVKSYGESEEISGNANHLKAVEFFGSKYGGDLGSTIAKYEIEQDRVFRVSTLEYQAETAFAKIGSQSVGKGLPQINASLPELNDIAEQLSKQDGKAVDYHRSVLLGGALTSYMRQEQNPELALEAINGMEGKMDENLRAQLEVQAQSKVDAKKGQTFGMNLFTQGMSDTQAVRLIMQEFGDNDTARNSALSSYSAFSSAQRSDRVESDRQKSEAIRMWSVRGGDLPDGVTEDDVIRLTGKSSGDYITQVNSDKPITAEEIYEANNKFSSGFVRMSKARTQDEVKSILNETETEISKINPKLAQQFAPKLAEQATKLGQPQYLDSMTKVEASIKQTFLQLNGVEYKPSRSGQSDNDKLYNRVLTVVMRDPSLQTPDGIKQTFIDQNREVVEKGWIDVFDDKYKRYEMENQSDVVNKDAVLLGININSTRSAGYKVFADNKMLDAQGRIKPQYRQIVAQVTKEFYNNSTKRYPYPQNPTPETVVAELKQQGILK